MTHEPFDRADTADPTAKSPLARILEPAIDEARIQANWHQIIASRAPRRRARIPRWSFAFAAAAVAAVVTYVAWPSPPHGGPLASTNAAIAVTPGAVVETPVTLDDGSVVELVAGTRLEVLTNEADRFVTVLHTGRAHFDVHPGGPRRWEIETPRATVEVVGTSFTVEASEHRVSVEVDRGVVVVRGERVPGRVVRLTAGQNISLEDPVVKTAEVPASPPPQQTPPPPSVSGVGVNPPPSISGPPVVVATRPAHVAPVAPAPVRPAPKRPTGLAPILADADRLRAAGDPQGAATVLEQALTGRPDESTGLVAFSLGRLYLDELGAPDKAAAAFAKVIALGTPRGLLEDAYARRIEALVKADRVVLARDALADYDRLYPHGVRRAALHTLVK